MDFNHFYPAGSPPLYSYSSPPPSQGQGRAMYFESPSSESLYFETPPPQHLCFPRQQPQYFQGGGGSVCGHCNQQLQQFRQEQLRFTQEQLRLTQNQLLHHQQAQQQLQFQFQQNPQPQLHLHLQCGPSGRNGMNRSLAAGAAGALWGSTLGLGLTGVAAGAMLGVATHKKEKNRY